jgi:hypothetical protein
MTGRSIHTPEISRREALLFEAGIKLGGVFHQYLGIPLSARTSRGLARAIENAVLLQPYVRSVRVRIDLARGGPLGRGRFAYRYLTAEMLDVGLELADGPFTIRARLAHRADLRYPLMWVEAASGGGRGAARSDRPRRRRRRAGPRRPRSAPRTRPPARRPRRP